MGLWHFLTQKLERFRAHEVTVLQVAGGVQQAQGYISPANEEGRVTDTHHLPMCMMYDASHDERRMPAGWREIAMVLEPRSFPSPSHILALNERTDSIRIA